MILHLIETGGPGGAEQMLLRLADEYARRGRSQMVCLRKEGWLAQQVRRRGLVLHILGLGVLPDLRWLCQLRQLCQRYRVKAIHSHEFAMNVRGAMLAETLRVPCAATVHGKGYYADSWTRRFAYRTASRFSTLVAVSEDIRRHLIDRVGIRYARVRLIHNGIDVHGFRLDHDKRIGMRARLGIAEGEVLLGTLGSYYPVKGHCFLIDAMQALLPIAPAVKLVMAGQGPLAEDLQRMVDSKGLRGQVGIIGYLEDPQAFLNALDIFVMPSLSEGHPLALLEAAAAGRCIVATNVGGVPEIVVDGENGLLVPPRDPAALAGAIARLLVEPETATALAANASITASRWSIERTADQYLDLLFPARRAGGFK